MSEFFSTYSTVLIVIGVVVLAVLIAGTVIVVMSFPPPNACGVSVQVVKNGNRTGRRLEKRRLRRIYLKEFDLEPVGGIDYTKSYIQATGKKYVLLRTNVPVPYKGADVREIEVWDKEDVRVVFPDGDNLIVQFEGVVLR